MNRRRTERAPVVLPASVVTMNAYQYFELVNLSATGGKLRGPEMPVIGKTALFRLDGYEVLCKVIWVKNDLCGVHFDEMIPPRVLARFREAGRTAKVAMATPDERQVDLDWTAQFPL